MGNIQMPIGPIGDKNVAVGSMRISDFVNFHVRRQNVYDYCVVERNYTGADLFSSDKLTVRRIHREEITFHADNGPIVGFYGPNEMTSRVARKKLAVNDVNVFA